MTPHLDDEIVGAGAHLSSIRDLWVVHVTDGGPRDLQEAIREGFSSREEFARVRRREAMSALRLAGVGPERCLHLEFPQHNAARHMPAMARRLVAMFRGLQPDTVLAPAYEGGHPDHDAVAMAVHAAALVVQRDKGRSPRIVEYALYHAWEGRVRAGEFLPRDGATVDNVALDPAARVLKCRMLACFESHRTALAEFPTDVERFRRAPPYDFTSPPHEGRLHYENYDCGIAGKEWRRHARATLRDLNVVSLAS